MKYNGFFCWIISKELVEQHRHHQQQHQKNHKKCCFFSSFARSYMWFSLPAVIFARIVCTHRSGDQKTRPKSNRYMAMNLCRWWPIVASRKIVSLTRISNGQFKFIRNGGFDMGPCKEPVCSVWNPCCTPTTCHRRLKAILKACGALDLKKEKEKRSNKQIIK